MQARWRADRVPVDQALHEAEVAVLAELEPVRSALAEATARHGSNGPSLARAVEKAHLEARGRRAVTEDVVVALVSGGGVAARETRHAMALLEVLARADRMMALCVSIVAMRNLMSRDTASLTDLLRCLAEMGEVADQQIAAAERVFADRDLVGLTSLRDRDRKLCGLHRRCLAAVAKGAHGNGSRNGSNLATLVARAIERVGEDAVAIGRQAAFLETGVAPPVLEADVART